MTDLTPHQFDRSGTRYRIDEPRWCGDDGSPLMVSPLPGITPQDIEQSCASQWRYAAALPDPHVEPISLGEGRTPMLTRQLAGLSVHVKVEPMNPTGSYKDRGSTVMLSTLRQQGVTDVLEDSSGNGGSSIAAYSTAGGLRAEILVPAATSPAKILQSRFFGATVTLYDGTRQETADEAVRRAQTRFYASHTWHPFFLQGIKLLAYEIWEDLGFQAPTAVLMPAGAGSLVLGCAMGFSELKRAGQISHVPRLLVSQPERCCPLVRALHAGHPRVAPADWSPTMAEGTAIGRPVRDQEVLTAIRESGGHAVAVAESDLAAATLELSATGLYAEPTSAQVVPALQQLVTEGHVTSNDTLVVILTGSGLKASDTMARLAAEAGIV